MRDNDRRELSIVRILYDLLDVIRPALHKQAVGNHAEQLRHKMDAALRRPTARRNEDAGESGRADGRAEAQGKGKERRRLSIR